MISLHDIETALAVRPAQRLGLGDITSDLEMLAGSTGQAGFAFRSNFTPEIVTPPAGSLVGSSAAPAASSGQPGIGDSLIQSAQPTVDAILPDGSRVTVYAPYGEATGDYRVYVGGALVFVGGSFLLTFFLGWLLGRHGKRGRR